MNIFDDLKGCGGDEWRGVWYPVTLIDDVYFEEYAKNLAEEIGALNSNASWPNNCINRKQAAKELEVDYSVVDFDKVTYLYR